MLNHSTAAGADTRPPTAPKNLVGTAVSSSQANLTWSASTDNVGVTGYLIERCILSAGGNCPNFAQVGTSAVPGFSDSAVVGQRAYQYRVRANDAAGNLSGYSNSVVVSTPTPDTQAPTAPTNLIATTTSSAQVNLSWTAATDNVGVTGYGVERCQGSACSNFIQIAAPNGTTFSDTGLTPSTNYTYRIRATDAANNLSNYTANVNATTQSNDGPITYSYSYDIMGRINHVSGSDGSDIEYQYDANGNITKISR